ncbi:hypothetical protein HJFPF1_00028 [Paramyrothecium foliicola]|nr:hypothetical protein HJFPF1_00028 [Paramyrothecium foliicola]
MHKPDDKANLPLDGTDTLRYRWESKALMDIEVIMVNEDSNVGDFLALSPAGRFGGYEIVRRKGHPG